MLSGNLQKKLALFLCVFLSCVFAKAQLNDPYVRVAKITVDSTQLISYMNYLKEGLEASIKKEPGVLRMYAVAEKIIPTKLPSEKNPVPVVKYNFYLQLCCI
ncbi:MAG: hypothetical protein ACKO1T_05515 [Sediminibacterium sp.]